MTKSDYPGVHFEEPKSLLGSLTEQWVQGYSQDTQEVGTWHAL